MWVYVTHDGLVMSAGDYDEGGVERAEERKKNGLSVVWELYYEALPTLFLFFSMWLTQV